jgi:hypothetical protein
VFVRIYHIGGQVDRKKLNNQSSMNSFCFIQRFNFSFSIRPKVTNVTANNMNSVLGSVLKLINNNIDTIEAPWMKRIAGKLFFFCLEENELMRYF